MNFCWYWFVNSLYQAGFIDREKFVSSWEAIQHLDEMQKKLPVKDVV